ncbi:MAG: calcium-binding protein [Janthinobacterium lividum]
MTGAVLTPNSKVLFQQGHAPVAIESIAAGIGPGEQPGLNMALFSHTSVAYPLHALTYDASGEMGITDGAGATALGLDANNPGGTVVETSADGSQVGAVINTQDLTQGGTVPFGPMALLTQWQAPETVAPFADPANGAFVAQLDLKLPYSELPGGPGAQTSSNQVVLYLGLTDTVSNRQIAYGEILFDSRGKASPFFGADNGPGGTGAAIVAQAAGAPSRYEVAVPGAASFQGAAWTGSEHFALEITPGTLQNAITAFNNTNQGATPFSTDLSRYILTNVSVDAEVEYFGQENSFSYSVSNMTLSEEAAPLTAAQVAAAPDASASSVGQAAPVSASLASVAVPTGPVTSVTAGSGPETITASAGTSYAVQAGAGTLTFLGSEMGSTVTGAAGDLNASGGAGRLTAFAGSGSSTLVGGAGGGNVLAGGSGNATLVGASGGPGDMLMGGSGGAQMFAGGGHSTVFGGTGASMLVSSTGDDLLVAGQGQSVVYTGSGNDTVWGSPTSTSQTVVVAGSGLALVGGGAGNDTMYGGSGLSTLAGGSGDQLMVAGSGSTVVFAGSGSDTVFGGPSGGTATVVGGAHAALVVLEAGAATVQAGSGGDTVFGGTGGDLIDTGAGSTVVQLSSASSQADTVTFGSGGAAVSGGGAAHSFLFGETAAGLDVISGFRVGMDKLVMAAPQRSAALAGAHDSAVGMMLPSGHGGSVVLQGVHSGGASLFG